jgi:hypothetical protein
MRHDWYHRSGEGLLAALWLAQPMTVALLVDAYTPNLDTHLTWADVAAYEVAGAAYAQKVLANKTTPYDAGTDRTDLLADDVVWGPGATFQAAYAAVYDNSGSKPLWSLIDFEGIKDVQDGVLTIDWAAQKVLYVVPV